MDLSFLDDPKYKALPSDIQKKVFTDMVGSDERVSALDEGTRGKVIEDAFSASLAPKEKGWGSEILDQAIAGFTIDAPQSVGKAMKYMSDPGKPLYDAGESLVKKTEQVAQDTPWLQQTADKETSPVKAAFSQGARMIGPSLAPAGAVGAAIAATPLTGTAALLATAGLSTIPMALAQAQETLDKAERAGVSREEAIPAARGTGAIEWGGETVGTYLGGKLLLGVGSTLFKKFGGAKAAETASAKILSEISDSKFLPTYLKQLAQTYIGEIGTEIGQASGQAAVEKAYGIDTTTPLEAGKAVVAPTAAMTTLLAPFGIPGHMAAQSQKNSIKSALNDPETPDEIRVAAARLVHDQLKTVDPVAAKNWAANATVGISADLPIDLHPDFLKPPEEAIFKQGEEAVKNNPSREGAIGDIEAGLFSGEVTPDQLRGMDLSSFGIYPDDTESIIANFEQSGQQSQADNLPAIITPEKQRGPLSTIANRAFERAGVSQAQPQALLPAPEGITYGEGFTAQDPQTQETIIRRGEMHGVELEGDFVAGTQQNPVVIIDKTYKTEKGARLALKSKAATLSPDEYDVFPAKGGFQIRSKAKAVQVDQAAHEAATSPLNDKTEPTEEQKSAGNYALGHTSIHGLDISIENPSGSTRSGKDKSGKEWSQTMQDHYGYIRGTVGRDKDHIDTFINPANPESNTVFVVDQVSPDNGNFDEHKVLMGFNSEEEARTAYNRNYEPGWQGLGAIISMPVEQFKEWLNSGKTHLPLTHTENATSTETTKTGKGKDGGGFWNGSFALSLREVLANKAGLDTSEVVNVEWDYLTDDEKSAILKAYEEKDNAKTDTVNPAPVMAETTKDVATDDGGDATDAGRVSPEIVGDVAKPLTPGGDGRKQAKEDVSTPERLTEAIGKPGQIATLEQMGVTDENDQIEQIVRDAVKQPLDIAVALKEKGNDEQAEKLIEKAKENGEKLKLADGVVTENAVDKALETSQEAIKAQQSQPGESATTTSIDDELKNVSMAELDALIDGDSSPAKKRQQSPASSVSKTEENETQDDLSLKSETQAGGESPIVRPLSATEIAARAAKQGATGVGDAMTGLYELFGGGSLKSFPGGINRDTYMKAKPHFESALVEFRAAGKSLKEFVDFIVTNFGEKVRPFLKAWVGEKQGQQVRFEDEEHDTVQPDTNEDNTKEGKGTEENVQEEPAPDEVVNLDAKEKKAKGDNAGTPRKRRTKEEIAADKKEAADKKKKKAAMGDFQNSGYVYDPEKLRRGVKEKSPKSAVKTILDSLLPSKVWAGLLTEDATNGSVRVAKIVQDKLRPFRDYLISGVIGRGYGQSDIARIEAKFGSSQETIENLLAHADEYMEKIKPFTESIRGQRDITGMIGKLQDSLFPGARKEDGTFPERFYELKPENKHSIFEYGSGIWEHPERYAYEFITDGWTSYLEEENDVLLSEINVHKRPRNTSIVRVGLPNHKAKLKETDDFKTPFGFNGVGFGEQSWINQDERNRVIPAAYNAFKDLIAVIGANEKGVGLGGQLAIQFANIGHLAKGAAAAYFPTEKTMNFTRDHGDGTLAHEWSHALHDLSPREVIDEIDQIARETYYTYDFEAGARLADDLLAKGSRDLSRIIDSKKQSRIEAVKEIISQRFVVAVRKETEYYKTAQTLDKDYTTRSHEMWARAFEAYVHDNLGGTNNYLVSDYVGDGKIGGKLSKIGRLVYPGGTERLYINGLIKHVMSGLHWSEEGVPSLKEGYVGLEKNREAIMEAEKEKLLAQVEARYNAIWASEPSADGNFWYSYNETAFGPMMQPSLHVAYDKAHKGEEQGGTGAVAYSHQLSPDEILDFGLTNIKYEGEGAVYISKNTGGFDELREDGEGSLEDISTEEDGRITKSRTSDESDEGSSGTGEGGSRSPGREGNPDRLSEGDSDSEQHTASPGNYRITDDTLTDPKGIDERFVANLSALRLLKAIETEDRIATEDEKDVLAKYTGWGGIGEAFSYDPKGVWVRRAELINSIMDRSEKDAAASSSPSAYYTPVPVARFMWSLAQRLGFSRGAVLDPATGASGIFIGTMPEELERVASLHGVEKDSISARIAAKLYDETNVENKGFQDSKKPMNRFDLTITNVPFEASVVPFDTKHNRGQHSLHNYFINKMLDVTAQGALSMVITTNATMDSPGSHLKEFADKADFVGAIRLPSGIYSGTQVTTDILVFRKKIEGGTFEGVPAEKWATTGKDESTGLEINQYFLDNPHMVAGDLEAVTGRWGDLGVRVVSNEDISARLSRIADNFPGNIVEREAVREIKSIDDLIPAPGTVKEGGLYLSEKGTVAWKRDGQEEVMPTATASEQRAAGVAKGFVGILTGVRAVLRSQRTGESAEAVQGHQKALKKAYDAFVKKNGIVNDEKNIKVFAEDPDASWVVALEEIDQETGKVKSLADLFTKNVAGPSEKKTTADTDHDALYMSLNEYGYPNLEYMAGLRGSTPEAVLKAVEDKIIENPETGFLETMEEYLSGQVKRKLAVAREMAAEHPEYARNVTLLEAAQPEDIPPHRITARIGSSWIDPKHLADFIAEKTNMRTRDLNPIVSFNQALHTWSLSFSGDVSRWKGENKAETRRSLERYSKGVEATKVWGTKKMNFFTLIEHALDGKRPVVTFIGADDKPHINAMETQAAESKLLDIQQEFGRWLFSDPTRSDEAAARFNDKVNTSVVPKYNGAHLSFPGKSMAILTPSEQKELGIGDAIAFYPHQMNAVWKYLRAGNQYLAHEVGAGKTVSMALIAMEARRVLGKKKVVYVTLNDSTMGQAVAEIKRLYPLANILPVQVSTNEQRKRLQLQKLALNDFDVAIMRQQDLDRISLSPDAEKVFIDAEIEEMREILNEAKQSGARILERDIQTRINALEEKLKSDKAYRDAKEKNMFFDDIGVDLLIVDEAHEYKNVPYATRLTGVTGMNPGGSKTAQEFFRKTQYLNAQFPKGDSLVLASGTPLTNSIAELFNIQKMLQPWELKRQGLWNFDRWIATYGEIGTQLEWDGAKQTHKTIVTNKRIVNAGRLLSTVFQNVDSVRAEDTPIKRPKIHGGESTAVVVKQNQYTAEYSKIAYDRAVELENDPRNAKFAEFGAEPTPDIMFRLFSNMSKVAIDQRLDARYADTEIQEESKIYKASRLIYKRWQEEKKNKGVQLVFADMGVPSSAVKDFKEKSEDAIEKMSDEARTEYLEEKMVHDNAGGKFNVYDGLTAELVKLGIPRDQIAFIHDADDVNKAKKAVKLRNLFRKVNNGDIRVFIGSTKKAGTGVNVQRRVSDVHHLDIWWNYSAYEQRNGRGIRAGNIYTDTDGVRIWNYVTEGTVDATRWDKVFAKGKVLNAVMGGDVNIDVIEDISQATMSAKATAAVASGNPLMKEHSDLTQKIQRFKYELSSYLDMIKTSKRELSMIPSEIEAAQRRAEKADNSAKAIGAVTAVKFIGDDRTYVLEKDGKAISEAVEKSVKKDGGQWDADKRVPLLVLGTFSEKESKGKDGKPAKEYIFKPITAKIDIVPADLAGIDRGIIISGAGISSGKTHLAEKKLEKGKDIKLLKFNVTGNISRALTSYVSNQKTSAKTERELIALKKENTPKLEAVVATPWAKQEEMATAETELRGVEAKMLATGQGQIGSPETGMPISAYRGEGFTMDDIAAPGDWAENNGVIRSDSRGLFIKRDASTLARFFQNRRKKFTPGRDYSGTTNSAADMMLNPGAAVYAPKAFTTVDGETRLWISDDKYVKPEVWDIANRIAGEGGKWTFSKMALYNETAEYLVHTPKGDTAGDIAVQVHSDSMPEGVSSILDATLKSISSGKKGTTVEKVQDSLRTFLKRGYDKMVSSGQLKVVQTVAELPGGEFVDLYTNEGHIAGSYDPKTGHIYLVADNIKEGDAESVMRHEMLHKVMREDPWFASRYDTLLDQFEKLKATDYRVQDAFKRVPKETPAELVREEAMAYFLEEKANHKAGFWQKVVALVRTWLMRMGIPFKSITTEDIITMFTSATKRMANKGKRTYFSGISPDSMRSQIQAAKAIYSKLEQVAKVHFLGMKAQGVTNFLAKQGVKKAEMEAVGLNEWLATKKPTDKVTQAELVDFVRANTVELKDVVLGEKGKAKLEDLQHEAIKEYAKEHNLYFDDRGPTGYSYLLDENNDNETVYEGFPDDIVRNAGIDVDEDVTREGDTQFSDYQEPGAVEGSYREMFVTAPGAASGYSVVPYGSAWGIKFLSDGEVVGPYSTKEIAEKEVSMMGTAGWQDGHSQYSDIANPVIRIRFNTVKLPAPIGGKQPNRIGESLNNLFGSKKSANLSLDGVKGVVELATNHDQIAKEIIAFIPSDVVDKLHALQLSPQDIFSNDSVIPTRGVSEAAIPSDVLQGVIEAIRKAGTSLRAKVTSHLLAGLEEEFLPATKASDLSGDEVRMILSPEFVNGGHVGEQSSSLTGASMGATKPVRSAGPAVELSSTDHAKAIRFHSSLLYTGNRNNASLNLLRIEEMQGPNPMNQSLMPGYLKDNIYQVGVKRILAYAKENGFDGVALATKPGMSAGETQADRYSLEKQVDSIGYQKRGENYNLTVWNKEGTQVYQNQSASKQEVADTVGKDMLGKMEAGTGRKDGVVTYLEDVDLKVGGEGLKQLYDHDLPAMLEAYGKGKMESAKLQGDSDFTGKSDTGRFLVVEGPAESRTTLGVFDTKQEAVSFLKENGKGAVVAEEAPKITMPYLPISDKTPESYPLFSLRADGTPDPKAAAFLKNLQGLYGKKGLNEKKGVRLIEKYENLIQTLKDDKKDIYAKQAALEKHIKDTLPPSERGKVISTIKAISRPSTEAGRAKMLQKGIEAVESAHERFEKRRQLAMVKKLLMKTAPKRNSRGVQANRSMGPEGNLLLGLVRSATKMSAEEGYGRAVDILERLDNENRMPTPNEANKLMAFQTFSGLADRSVFDIMGAVESIKKLIAFGKSEYAMAEEGRKAEMNALRDAAMKEFTGGKGLKTEAQENLDNSDTSWWKRFKDSLRTYDDMHQSFEFLLDKLTRFDKTSGTLKGSTTEHFARKAFEGHENEHSGIAAHQNLFHEKLMEIYGKKGLGKKLKENTVVKKDSGVTRATETGRETMPLSQNQAYKLWQMFQQPSISEEMLKHGYDGQTLEEVSKVLTPETKAWAKWQIEEFYPQYREGINDVYKKLFSVNMPNIEGYSPISRKYNKVVEDDAMLGESPGMMASVLRSAVKSRTKNSRGFNIHDGDSVLLKHMTEMEHFKAWGETIREMRSVLGNEGVQAAVKQYHGAAADGVLQKFLDDFASGGVDRKQTLNFLDKMRSNFTKAVIGANPVVFVKQLSSMPAYMVDIPVKDFIYGVSVSMSNPVKAYRTLMQSKTMQARYTVGFERDIMLAMRRKTSGSLGDVASVGDRLMIGVALGDKMASVLGGYSVYLYHMRKNKAAGQSADEAAKNALREFDRATKRGQQAGETMDLPHFMRMGSMARLFTMFMSNPAGYYRSASAGMRNFRGGRGSRLDNMKRVAVTWILLPMLFQWIASGFDWEDDAMARAALVGPLNGLFIARDIIDAVAGGLFGERVYGSIGVSPALSGGQKLAWSAAIIHRMMMDEDTEKDSEKLPQYLSEVLGMIVGLPFGPAMRSARGAMDEEAENPVMRTIGFPEKKEAEN